MTDINPSRTAAILMHGLSGANRRYTFYYDETNNIRKLYLRDGAANVSRPECFVVGGVVHQGALRHFDLGGLRQRLRIQPSAEEIKFRHLGNGPFLDLLKSDRVFGFLQWLEVENLFVHYQITDLFYWSIVDIVDSILADGSAAQLRVAHADLKDSLYTLVRDDFDGTMELLGRYNYPDVGDRQHDFLSELLELAEYRQDMLPHFHYFMLKGVLQMGRSRAALPFLADEQPNMLISGFGDFYANRLTLFKFADHILDREDEVEARIASLGLRDGDQPLGNYRFADSKVEPGIQISDLVIGLLGKLFTYINRTPLAQIALDFHALEAMQHETLAILARIIDRSIGECSAFAQFVISNEDRGRASFVLEDEKLMG